MYSKYTIKSKVSNGFVIFNFKKLHKICSETIFVSCLNISMI